MNIIILCTEVIVTSSENMKLQ